MCSLVIKPSLKNGISSAEKQAADHNQHELTIPQFWSRQGDWSPGCSISANIMIGEHACLLQVFPTGREVELQDQQEGEDVLNVSNEEEDISNFENSVASGEEITKCDIESDLKENAVKSDQKAVQVKGLSVELVNVSDFDLVIEGELSIGLARLNVKCEQLPRAGRIEIIDVGRKKLEMLEMIRDDGSGDYFDDDLKIVMDWVAQSKFGQVTGIGIVGEENKETVLNNKQEEMMVIKYEKTSLQVENSTLQSQSSTLQAQIKTLQSDQSKLLSELAKSIQSEEERKQELTQLQLDYDNLNTEHEQDDLQSNKLDISEVNLKVSKIGPMLAELRDQFQSEMESMQDILLETPLSAEVSDLRKDVSLMKAELATLIKAELNAQKQALTESLPQDVSKEVGRDLIAQQDANSQAQARDTVEQMTSLKQDIINSVYSLKDSFGGTSARSNLSEISEVKLQLEMLQDSVLTAISSPSTVAMPSYPECPYCMEELLPPAKILQVRI